jgi:hypothetical protein
MVEMENQEWGAAEQTVAFQTPTPIPCSQISEAITNNPGVDFVANSNAETVFLNPDDVSIDPAAYAKGHLRNTLNELRYSTSSIPVATSRTRGKIGRDRYGHVKIM